MKKQMREEQENKLQRIKKIEILKMKREKILQQYNNLVGENSSRAREVIMKLDFRKDAYLLHCIAQTYYDESLFNDDGSQREFFVMRKLRLAEKYIIEAYMINEGCINVLWTLGKIRKAFGQFDLAIYCFKRIIEIGSKKIGEDDNCTNRSLVKIKVNDSKFQLYRLYHDKSDFTTARKFLSLYKIGLKKDIGTLYKPLKKFLLD